MITKATPDIKVATGKDVELWLVDLAQLDSVLQFADKFEKDGGRPALQALVLGIADAKAGNVGQEVSRPRPPDGGRAQPSGSATKREPSHR